MGRPALARPGLSLLNIASIALGVAVFLAVQIASNGAMESFRSSVALTTGRADLEIRGDLDDRLLPAVAAVDGVRRAAPLVEGILPLLSPKGEYLRVAGVEPFLGRDLLGYRLVEAGSGQADIERWLREPGILATSAEQAARMREWSGSAGGTVEVLAGTRVAEVTPAFEMVSDEPLARAEPRLAAMDIGWAQELLGMQGRLTSIQILVEPGHDPGDVAAAIRSIVPGNATVAPPVARNDEMRAMLGAFHLNLTAMSLVSVIVGMFLIFNGVSAAVVRRQHQIAILRAVGATRGEIRGLFLGEAVAEAAVGAVAGIFAAPLLAGLVATPVADTISSLYKLVSINALEVTPPQAALGLAIGIGAALVAAWIPAAEAANTDPARILHAGAPAHVFSPRKGLLLAWASACLAMAWLTSWLALSGWPPPLGFVSAGFVIAGFSLLVPWFANATARLGPLAGLTGRLAADHLRRSLHRNAITIAALSAAVAMSVAVSVMIHSFRESVTVWVNRTLTAELYIAPAANETGGLHAFLPDDAAQWVRKHPAIASVATFREMPFSFRGRPAALAVLEGRARGELDFLPGPAPDAQALVDSGKAVALSESFVSRFGMPAPVDGTPSITLPTPAGDTAYPVAGICRDFTRDSGTVLIARSLFEQSWNDPRLHSLAVHPVPGADITQFTGDFRRQFGALGQFAIYDNAALKSRIFEIFEQTFAVTAALRAVAVLVAVVGVAFSLGILATERTREIGVLRALGASRRQILGVFVGEAALLGIASALAGLASGATLAMVLTWVVNKAFFGWTVSLAYPFSQLALTPVWLAAVAILAALVPAWKAARTPPAAAVRFE